jgi:hypothetical protein
VALRGASGRPRGSVLGENVTSQVTFSPLAWRRACFATASPATVTTLRSLCVPFAARTRGTTRAGRGWTAFAATMAVNAVHPPASPAIRDGRHRERHDSPRLCFPSVPCVAQHRPRSRTTKRPGPGHLSPPVGGGWPATGNDRWSRPANAPRHHPPWASMAEHLRPSTERPGHRATTEHATRRPPPTPRRRQSRDKARQAHAGSTTAADRVGPGARPTNTGAKPFGGSGDPAPPDHRRKHAQTQPAKSLTRTAAPAASPTADRARPRARGRGRR